MADSAAPSYCIREPMLCNIFALPSLRGLPCGKKSQARELAFFCEIRASRAGHFRRSRTADDHDIIRSSVFVVCAIFACTRRNAIANLPVPVFRVGHDRFVTGIQVFRKRFGDLFRASPFASNRQRVLS